MNLGPGELLVIVLLSGIVAALIAGSRGLRPGRYFLIGVAMPFVGPLLAIIARERHPARQNGRGSP